jgi:hypothetical protein
VDKEAANELAARQRHDLLPLAALGAVVPAQNSETARKSRDYCAAAIPSSA